ncbi:hypothetical protein [Herbaspirillum robiniae]|uniref:hypothetical protein n=1 Tax=Herbaspirillum robiniae TaxID=2014887 RepID=UPI0013FE0C6F|nr:hypothetical protein [Herbaspirillum robiniae]
MEEKSSYKRSFSDISKSKMQKSAVARADRSSLKLREAIDDELEKIWHELAKLDPSLQIKEIPSLANIARRAGIHPQTLHKPRYRVLTQNIKNWILEITPPSKPNALQVRKSPESAVAQWKKKYNDLLDKHCLSEIDLLHASAQLELLQKENEMQATTIKNLTADLRSIQKKLTVVK